jgi:N-acetyl-anhydromuramyl-L-alanine amidase AmpD
MLPALAPATARAHERETLLGSAGIANPPAAARSAAPLRTTVAAGADYPRAAWHPASVWNYTDAERPADDLITRLVIHVAEGGFASTYSWFQSSSAQASAHYVVGKQGQVAQMVADHDIAWHAGNWTYNASSIGIEHEGYTHAGGFTDTQYRASAALAGYLARSFAITPDRAHVIGHNEVPDPYHRGQYGGADHHTDPGPYWNWPRYMAYLRLYAQTTSQRTGDDVAGRFSATGWTATTPGSRYGATARMASPSASGQPARYKVSLPATDAYDVFVRWPCRSDANRTATVGLVTLGGYRMIRVDQRARCAVWVPVGSYRFSGGDAWRVQVSRRSATAGPIQADAVRFVRWTDPVPPSAPSGLGVGPVTSTSIAFSWGVSSDNVGVWGYQAFLDGHRVQIGQSRTFTASGLACETSHVLNVRAVDLVANRSALRTVTVSTGACPEPVSDLMQTASTDTTATVSWTASPSAVARYLVWVPGRSTRTTTATTTTLTGFACGTSSSVYVRAQDADGGVSPAIGHGFTTAACH